MPGQSEREQAKRIAAELRGVVERTVRTAAGGVLSNLAKSTPVDTAATAASWRANRRPNGPVVRRSRRAVARAKAEQAASQAALAGYKLEHGRVHVGSAQPGIEQLDAGSSKKEPAGFVQRAIRKAVSLARALGR